MKLVADVGGSNQARDRLQRHCALNGNAPAYLSAMLSRYEPVRPLRSSDTGLLNIPEVETKTHREAAFSFYGPTLWNGLPVNLRLTQSIDSFNLF